MENNKIFELNDEELDEIAGGIAYVNGNTNIVAFSTTKKMYRFKNCTFRDVRNLCEDLIGTCATDEEYDLACTAALQAKGWI